MVCCFLRGCAPLTVPFSPPVVDLLSCLALASVFSWLSFACCDGSLALVVLRFLHLL
jgi:hypothetical protein